MLRERIRHRVIILIRIGISIKLKDHCHRTSTIMLPTQPVDQRIHLVIQQRPATINFDRMLSRLRAITLVKISTAVDQLDTVQFVIWFLSILFRWFLNTHVSVLHSSNNLFRRLFVTHSTDASM